MKMVIFEANGRRDDDNNVASILSFLAIPDFFRSTRRGDDWPRPFDVLQRTRNELNTTENIASKEQSVQDVPKELKLKKIISQIKIHTINTYMPFCL